MSKNVKGIIKSSNGSTESVLQKTENDNDKPNEYEYDSSDEEDIRNTVGNIPMNWYDDYNHLGYDWDGKPIRKPKRGDELDKFLNRMDNPEHGMTGSC